MQVYAFNRDALIFDIPVETTFRTWQFAVFKYMVYALPI